MLHIKTLPIARIRRIRPMAAISYQALFNLLPWRARRQNQGLAGDHLLFDFNLSAAEYNHYLDRLEAQWGCYLPAYEEGTSDTLSNLAEHISQITQPG